MADFFKLLSDKDAFPSGIPVDSKTVQKLEKDEIPTAFSALTSSEMLYRYYRTFENELRETDEEILTEDDKNLLKSHCPAAHRRNMITLKRIKQKGYWAENPLRLREVYSEYESAHEETSNVIHTLPFFYLMAATNAFACYGKSSRRFTEDEWLLAIEYGMLMYDPKVFATEGLSSFAPYLEDAMPYIWLCLITAHLAVELDSRRKQEEKIEKGRIYLEAIQKLKDELEKQTAETDRRARAAADIAKSEERGVWREKVKELEKNHCNDLAAKDRYIRILERQVDALSEAPPPEERQKQDLLPEGKNEEAISSDSQKAELPEEGVVFLGGWEAIQKNIRNAHPKWTVIGVDGAERLRIGSSTKLAFFWYRYCSHKASQAVFAKLPVDAEVVFVSSANMDLLEQEMRVGYGKALEKRSGSK